MWCKAGDTVSLSSSVFLFNEMVADVVLAVPSPHLAPQCPSLFSQCYSMLRSTLHVVKYVQIMLVKWLPQHATIFYFWSCTVLWATVDSLCRRRCLMLTSQAQRMIPISHSTGVSDSGETLESLQISVTKIFLLLRGELYGRPRFALMVDIQSSLVKWQFPKVHHKGGESTS